ncbi:MAG: hypothetical protein WDW38_008785 [Sanguina aurantia]
MCSAPMAPSAALPIGLSAAAADLLQPPSMCAQLQQLPFSSIMYGDSTISRGSSFIDMGELDTCCSLGGREALFLIPDDTPAGTQAACPQDCLLQMLDLQVSAPSQPQRPSIGSGSCDIMFQPGSSVCCSYGGEAGDDSSCEDDARCFEQALQQLSQLGCGGEFNSSNSPSPPAAPCCPQPLRTTFAWDAMMPSAFIPRAPVVPSWPLMDPQTASCSRSLSPALPFPFQTDAAPSLLIPPDIKPLLNRASQLLQPLAVLQKAASREVAEPLPLPLAAAQASSDFSSEEAILSSSSDLWHQPLLPILSDASNATLLSLAAFDEDSLTTQHLSSLESDGSDLQSAVLDAAAAGGSDERAAAAKPSHQHKNGGPCDHCGTSESPQWRRGPSNKPTLCNACGTRFRRTNQLGPAGLNAGSRPGGGAVRSAAGAADAARGRKDSAAAAAAAREQAATATPPVPKEKEVLPAKRIPKRIGHYEAEEAASPPEERTKRQRVPSRHK